MKSFRILAVAAVALTAAACQTAPGGYTNVTQQVYGDVNPAIPANWTRTTTRTGAIMFNCPFAQCDDPGAISYQARVHNFDQERLFRKKIITAGLIMEVSRSISNASSGRYKVLSVRDLSGRSAAGFEITGSMQTNKGTLYGVSRSTINGRESRSVTGMGMSSAKARRNLQIGLQGAR